MRVCVCMYACTPTRVCVYVFFLFDFFFGNVNKLFYLLTCIFKCCAIF